LKTKFLTFILLTLLLLAFVMPLLTSQVGATETYTVYIRPNGDITDGAGYPITPPIVTTDQITYTLTHNFTGTISIEKSDIILDGAGYIVDANTAHEGVRAKYDNNLLTNIVIKNLGVKNSAWMNIYLFDTANCTVRDCHVTGSGIAVEAYYYTGGAAVDNLIYNNTVSSTSGAGIRVGSGVVNSTVTYNTVNNAYYGIMLDSVGGGTVVSNNWIYCPSNTGLYVFRPASSATTTVTGNTFLDCDTSFYLEQCVGFTFYGNNLLKSTQQVDISSPGSNNWDHNGVGNYWSDYTSKYPNAQKNETSGVWDTPYSTVTALSEFDHYPQVSPFGVYLLNVTSVGCGNPSLSTGLYYEKAGAEVTVTATPNNDKAFLYWVLDGEDVTDNPITVTMDHNHDLEAVFEIQYWNVTINTAVNGRVEDSEGHRVDGTTLTNITDTSQLDLYAVPDAGYAVNYWYGAMGTEYYITHLTIWIYDNSEITVYFDVAHTLTVESSKNGQVYNGDDETVDGTAISIVNGRSYDLYAQADEGYTFIDFQVNGVLYSTESQISLIMDQNYTVAAVFGANPIYILPEPGTHAPTIDKVLWSYQSEYSGFDSKSVIVDDVAYVVSEDGYLYAINITTALPIWGYSVDDDVHCAPTVADGVVYIIAESGDVYALKASDGEQLWSYYTGDDQYASATVVDGVVYVATEYYVYALSANPDSPDGELLWSVEMDGALYYSPTVVDGVLYVATEYGDVYALDTTNEGQELWCYSIDDDCYASPTVANGIVYIGAEDGYMYALLANTSDPEGECIWAYYTDDYIDCTATVVDGVVYFGTCDYNCVYALNATTDDPAGEMLWCFEVGMEIYSAPIVVDNVVYINAEDGVTFAFNATPVDSEGELLWYHEFTGYLYDSPSYSNGVLYVSTTDDESGSLVSIAANSRIVFIATGLPEDASWSVTFGGITQTSTSNVLTFVVCPNGEYTYNIEAPDGYYTGINSTGTIDVNGTDVNTEVTFVSDAPAEYTLTLEVYLDGVSLGNDVYSIVAGEEVHLYIDATPPGMAFDYIYFDGVNITETELSFIMDQNYTVQAYFVTEAYTLTVTTTVGGSVSSADEVEFYRYGDIANLTATPDEGYSFTYWMIDGVTNCTENPLAFPMDGNHTITAVFSEIPTTIIASDSNQTYTVRLEGNITARQMSNMTITPHQENSTTTISFTVTGPSGTEGYGTIILPKEAIPYGSTPLVYIDGVLAENQTYTEDDDYYYISYSTHFSTHDISIIFTSPTLSTTSTLPRYPITTNNTQPTTTPSPTPIPTPAPTTTPKPTETPTVTPTQSSITEYVVLAAAVAGFILVLFGVVYRKKHHNKW
jgi:outer membrane protein assembly factor BamB